MAKKYIPLPNTAIRAARQLVRRNVGHGLVNTNIEGLDTVLLRMHRELEGVVQGSLKGLVALGLFILSESGRLVPVDVGNLRASGYLMWENGAESSPGGFKGGDAAEMSANHTNVKTIAKFRVRMSKEPVVLVGYSAYYAIYVHEDLTANHNKLKRVKHDLAQVIITGRKTGVTLVQTGTAKFLQKAVDIATPMAASMVSKGAIARRP